MQHASTDTTMKTTQPSVPAQDRPVGWYRDDTQPNGHRYWDGSGWTTDLDAADPR